MYVKTFEQFSFETNITRKLIEILHEGIRVVPSITLFNESSNVKNFAQKEIDLVIKHARSKNDTALIEEFVPEMLALIDKFGNSGQSGGSAPFTAGAITHALEKLLLFKPIAPITNEKDEWSEPIDGTWQHTRCYSLFKESENGDPYYLDAIVWKTPNGATYTGSAFLRKEKIRSRQFVREFPFEPKSFVIDVDEKEVAPDDWDFYIKDPEQLKEVLKYYKNHKI